MKNNMTPELLAEATAMLEAWARAKQLVAAHEQLVVSISTRPMPSVCVEINQNYRNDAEADQLLASPSSLLLKHGVSDRAAVRGLFETYKTIGWLMRSTDYRVLKQRGLGRKTLGEIKEAFAYLGLTFGEQKPAGQLELDFFLEERIYDHFRNLIYHPENLTAAGLITFRNFYGSTDLQHIMSALTAAKSAEISAEYVYGKILEFGLERGVPADFKVTRV